MENGYTGTKMVIKSEGTYKDYGTHTDKIDIYYITNIIKNVKI